MASEYTENYNLDLYVDTDKPNLRDQYNSAVRKIDQQLKTNAVNITTAQNTANDAHDIAKQAQADVATEKTERESAINGVKDLITAETAARENADTVINNTITALDGAYKSADAAIDAAYKAADAAINERIDGISSSIQLSKYRGHRVVFIGDSYAYGTGASDHLGAEQNRFTTQLTKMLGAIEVNVAVGSTGFCDPGSSGQQSPFPTQVTIAANRLNQDERQDVRLVVIAGGINDDREGTTYSSSQMVTAAKSTCINAHDAFPQADIVVFPMLFNGQGFTLHTFNFANRIAEGVLQSGCARAINGCWTWNFGNAGNYKDDNLHPNDAGHALIANRMYESIVGGGTENYQNQLFTPSIDGGSTANRTYGSFINGTIHMGSMAVGKSGTTYSGNTQIGTVPKSMYPEVNVYAPIFKSNQLAGMFCITQSGNVYINPQKEVEGPVYVTGFSYMPYGGVLN